jgi:Ca2+-binding EF-hand superfamily protein
LTEKGPVVLRLHLLVDGQPAAAVRTQYFDKLFADLDRDGDGFLSKTEAARAPSVAFLQSFLNGGTAVEAKENTAPFDKLDIDGDGRVSRREFDAYYRGAQLDRLHLVTTPTDHEAIALNEVLFHLLDRDGDGKLSRGELKQSAASLRAVDFNDDEWITPDELLTVSKDNAPRPKPEAPMLLERLTEGGEDVWKKAVLQRYGQFDKVKLAALWQRQPDLELRIRLDTRRRAPAEKVVRAEVLNPTHEDRPLEKDIRTTPEGELHLSAGTLELEVQVADAPEAGVRSMQQFLRQQFQAADADGKGVLTRKQAEDAEVLAGLFIIADRDGDGMLSEQELTSFLDLHALGAVSFTTVVLTDRSLGLFELLDADHDRRLSLRELATAWDRLRVYDRNNDDILTREELPRRLQLKLVQGKANPHSAAAQRPAAKPVAARGPAWFRKMDRNGDGYVSRREWLGSEELFRRLDTDGDGLISPEEAAALEGLLKHDKSDP